MTKPAKPKAQAPKVRNKPAQGNALGNAPPEDQSPEGAGQRPSSHPTTSVRPLSSFLREPLRNGHSATASADPNGIRTLTLTAVTVGDFSERNTKITSADAHRVKDLWLEPGDILIQRSNAPELVGTSRLYRGDRNYAIFPDLMIRVRLSDEADPRFVELVLQSQPLRQYFKGRAKGMSGSMPKIDQETISEAPIPHFHIDDQRRIVAEIEKQFTRLEAGVAALRRVQANLKRYRAAVLKAACEGRLVPTEAELARAEGRPFESGQQLLARILTERRQNWQCRGQYKETANLSASGYELNAHYRFHKAWTLACHIAVTPSMTSGHRPEVIGDLTRESVVWPSRGGFRRRCLCVLGSLCTCLESSFVWSGNLDRSHRRRRSRRWRR